MQNKKKISQEKIIRKEILKNIPKNKIIRKKNSGDRM